MGVRAGLGTVGPLVKQNYSTMTVKLMVAMRSSKINIPT